VNQFNRDGVDSSFVFLLSAKSGGVGLNLIGANRLVLIDSDWNPSTDLQAMARIHRDGQKKVCYIYRLLLSGTMDEKIYQRQISKLGLTDSLIKGDKSSSDTFSQEELRDIFTLHLDSPCISHRQLVCDCDRRGGDASLDGLAEGMDASQTSVASSDDDLPGFVAASQHVVDRAQKDKLDKRKRLLALYKWAHYDCVQHPESFEEDEMVAALVRASRSSVRANGAEKSEDEWSTSMAERADDLFLGSDDSERDEDGMGEQQTDGGEGFRLDAMQTGRVLFVFAKSSDKTPDKVESHTTPPALD
jgi:DNA repair and recombination protein RAD54B